MGKSNNLRSLLGNVNFYIIITFIFFIFAISCFTWNIWDTFSLKLPIDATIWGQFGDFIGGTLGVIFSLVSVMLVVWTFKTQNRTAETQRFNDLFFELLRLYQEQEKELQFNWINEDKTASYVSNNKDFFDKLSKKFWEEFVPSTSFSKNRKEATKTYVNVTIDYKSKLSLCYRTIFQILNLIENSQLNQKERVEYLKILRAQLTESELLFIRYHIKSGEYKRFAYLVNKSNLLKHLPLFELLEFAYWRNKLDKYEIKNANNFYIYLVKSIKENKSNIVSNDKSLEVKINRTYNSLQLKFIKCNTSSWVQKFDKKEFENLCEGIIKEIVMFSNYSCYNNYKELSFMSAETEDNITIVKVKNKANKALNIIFNENMSLDNIDKIF